MKTISTEPLIISVLVRIYHLCTCSDNILSAITVIQGHSDIKISQFEDQLRETIDFCQRAFGPEPEPEVAGLAAHAPEASKDKPKDGNLAELDQGIERVFNAVAERKEMTNEDLEHIDNLVADKFHGLRLRLQKGTLGLENA
jgi:hypothetical protein